MIRAQETRLKTSPYTDGDETREVTATTLVYSSAEAFTNNLMSVMLNSFCMVGNVWIFVGVYLMNIVGIHPD